MSYIPSQTVHDAIRQFMVGGSYASEDQLLLDAFSALRQREDLAAVRDGIADFEAGRVRPLDDVFDDLRRELDIQALEISVRQMEAGQPRPFDEVAEEIRRKYAFEK